MRATPLHREVFKAGSKTYFNSSLFFPADVRDDVFVLYGFVRVADNFVDAIPQQPDQFHAFVDTYRRAAGGETTGDTIIDTFVDLAREKEFDPAWTDAFLHSMELDLVKSRYETIDEMLEYVYGSAEVIGLYMSRIMGLDRRADDAAMMLGRAMQVINFIRDIAEDNTLGRIYLPIGESSLPDLGEATARTNAAEYRRFIRAQLERYQSWQAEAERGYEYIPRRYLIPIKTAADMYNWTAEQIAEDPFVVFRRKVKPARPRIVARAARNAVAREKGE
jgi:phytoene synthase